MSKNYSLEKNQFGNIDCTSSLPKGWVRTTLRKNQLAKLKIPYYEACFGFTQNYKYYKPILGNIIPVDFEQMAIEYNESLKKKKEKIDELPLTLPLIAEALYSINKEAKRQRDIKQKHADIAFSDDYYEDNYERKMTNINEHYIIGQAKERQCELYELKECALEKLVAVNELKPVGFHRFEDMNRDYYEIEGFGFHVNKNDSKTDLGEIDTIISAERKRSIPPTKAKRILKRYIEEV